MLELIMFAIIGVTCEMSVLYWAMYAASVIVWIMNAILKIIKKVIDDDT